MVCVVVVGLAGCTWADSPSGRAGSASPPPAVAAPSDTWREPRSRSVVVEFNDETSSGYEFTPEQQAFVRRVAQRAAVDVAAQLTDLPDDLSLRVVAVDGFELVSDNREAAWLRVADGRPYIRWEVDTSGDESLVDIARANLRGVLFHEWHHLARGWGVDTDMRVRLIDAVVAEGLATAFARDAAGYEPSFAVYPDDVSLWARELMKTGSMDDYGEWMYQHPDGRRWIGYRVGIWIADRAMDTSDRSAAELIHATTDEVVEWAGLTRDLRAGT